MTSAGEETLAQIHEKFPPRMHVCSLSINAIKRVERDLELEETTCSTLGTDELIQTSPRTYNLNRLRWVRLSMTAFRFYELQYVYEHLGDKSSDLRFRSVRMKPALYAWRKELLRKNWKDIYGKFLEFQIDERIGKKLDYFRLQRIELSYRYLKDKLDFDKGPLADLLSLSVLEHLDCLRTIKPASLFVGNNNHFCETEACTSFPPISADPEDPLEDDWVTLYLKEKLGIKRPAGSDNTTTFKENYMQQKSENADGESLSAKILSEKIEDDGNIFEQNHDDDNEDDEKVADKLEIEKPYDETISSKSISSSQEACKPGGGFGYIYIIIAVVICIGGVLFLFLSK